MAEFYLPGKGIGGVGIHPFGQQEAHGGEVVADDGETERRKATQVGAVLERETFLKSQAA